MAHYIDVASKPTADPPDETPARRPLVHWFGVLALVAPMAAIAFWIRSLQETAVAARILFLGPLVGGGILTFWVLFLHVVVCKDAIHSLGFRGDRLWIDLLLGLGLAVLGLVVHFSLTPLLARAFPPHPPAPQVVELIRSVAANPILLTIWLGPVVWVGVALFEEISRTFLLRRLWRIWPGLSGAWAGITFVSLLVGLMHWAQGPAAVLVLSLQSVWLGWVFLKTQRILALVVSHALYDSIQIIMAVVTLRQLGA